MKLIFGIGTGRCGTHSLSELLNKQEGLDVTHELGDIPFLPWYFDVDKLNKYLEIIKKRKKQYCGDVAFYLLPYVEYIIKRYPESKFIALKREKEKTLKSFIKKTEGRNHWQRHNGSFFVQDAWDKCFPKYYCSGKEKALDLYYDEYYNTVESLIKKYPKNISLYNLEELNNESGVSSVLNFIGIKKQNQKIKTNIKIKARKNGS